MAGSNFSVPASPGSTTGVPIATPHQDINGNTVALHELGYFDGSKVTPVTKSTPLPIVGAFSATSTVTPVLAAVAGAVGNLLGANSSRIAFSVDNPSDSSTMYVLFGNTIASAINYSRRILPGATLDNEGWQGAVSAYWSVADGSHAMVTEFTP